MNMYGMMKGKNRGQMDKETYIRSALKSIVWRLTGILILGSITYIYTQHWTQTGLITLLHHGIFLFVFYAHERIWMRLKHPVNLTARSIAKVVTYETFLGSLILGAITYLITGNWRQMTQITITYISLKHIIYVINEFVWKKKIKLGMKD